MIQKPVAVFSEDFPPTSGGIAQWALGVAAQLGLYFEPVFVFTKRKSVPDRCFYQDAPFTLIRMRGHDWRKYRAFYSRYYGWKFLLKHSRPILIATTWGLSQGLYPLKKAFSFTLITVAHGLEVTRKSTDKGIRKMQNSFSRSDFCVAVSRFTKRRIQERIPLDPSKIRVLPNGIDLDRFYPGVDTSDLRHQLGLAPETKVIMTLARVVERKGHDTVIRALPKILDAHPNTVYLIAGPGREWVLEGLKNLVRQLKLEDRVRFTGLVTGKDLVLYYNLADVYIMVSRELEERGDTEGFGIAFLEANGCGKPVIGSTSGGIPDAVVDGETGFLVDPLDTDAVAERVIRLLSDPALAKRLGKNGRLRIQKQFTWGHVTKQLVQWMEPYA